MVKHSKVLFRFTTVLGIVFVTTFFVFFILDFHMSQNLWLVLFPSFYLRGVVESFLLFGGSIILIVGIVGLGRPYFKDEQRYFTMLISILVPLLISILIFLLVYFAPLKIGF